jgi:rhodanese-related sulfurtransferase
MALATQILRLCAVAVVATALLGWVRGLPALPEAPASGAGTCQAPEGGGGSVSWISQEQAKALVDDPHVAFVDCREREQFESGHVSGSVHLQLRSGEVPTPLFGQLSRATTVITYCGGQGECQRSLEIASVLKQQGLPDVRVLEGGMPGWLDLGYPAESGTCRDCEARP